MTVDLDELERLEKAATPGPWLEHDGDVCVASKPSVTSYPCGASVTTYPGPEPVLSGTPVGYDNSSLSCRDEDRRLVIACRNALPALIAELRAARERIAALEHRERAAYREGFDAHVRQCDAFGLFKQVDLALSEASKEIDEFGRKADELFGAEVTGGRTEGEP